MHDQGLSISDAALVSGLARVWSSIIDLCDPFAAGDWHRPSVLPGWTVQDVVAHMLSTESLLLGRPAPAHRAPTKAHVRNPLGEFVEHGVDAYRSEPGSAVLAEFRAVTTDRLAALRALRAEDFDADSDFPLGRGTVRDTLWLRLVDCAIHEQDIRVAVDRPRDIDPAVWPFVFERLCAGMGKVVGKLAAAPEGASVHWIVGDDRSIVTVRDGRGVIGDPQDLATVTLTMDRATFVALAAGRGDQSAEEARVVVSGDDALGARVLAHMNVMI